MVALSNPHGTLSAGTRVERPRPSTAEVGIDLCEEIEDARFPEHQLRSASGFTDAGFQTRTEVRVCVY